jgi:type I restriction enzyme S subunit
MTQTQHFIPEGWSRVPLSKLLSLEYGRALPRDTRGHGAFPVVGSSGIVGFHHEGFVDGPSIVVGRKGNAGAVSPIIHCCWPIDTTYYVHQRMDMVYEWLHRALSHARLGAVQSATGVPGLGRTDAYKICLLLPPRPEQRAIAHVLTTLDDLIADTEAAIAKLEAIRQGLLHDLLTRGLDENGEVRDSASGPEPTPLGRWLREAPRNGYSPEAGEEFSGTYMLGLGCLTTRGFMPCQLKFAPVGDSGIGRALLCDGDVLVSRANTRALVGLVGTYRDIGMPCSYPDLMMRLRPQGDVHPHFLELLLRSAPVRRQIQAHAVGTSESMVKISSKIVCSLNVRVPNKTEQKEVCSRIGHADDVVDTHQKALGKLKWIRAGLSENLLSGRSRVTPGLLGLPPEDGNV